MGMMRKQALAEVRQSSGPRRALDTVQHIGSDLPSIYSVDSKFPCMTEHTRIYSDLYVRPLCVFHQGSDVIISRIPWTRSQISLRSWCVWCMMLNRMFRNKRKP